MKNTDLLNDLLQRKLNEMEERNPSIIRKKSLLTRFKEYRGSKKLRLDVQSRQVFPCHERVIPFSDYLENSVREEVIKAEVSRLYEGCSFHGRFKVSSWHVIRMTHPIMFDNHSPFDEDTKFHYQSSSYSLSERYYFNYASDPLDDITLLVRNLNPGFLMMQNTSNELFTGHLVGLSSPDRGIYDKVKKDLLEYGFEECFTNIYF